jgi:hypothetical protein
MVSIEEASEERVAGYFIFLFDSLEIEEFDDIGVISFND